MQTSYTGHFLEALAYLLNEGTVANQAEFCRTMGLDENAISAFRRGARNVTIDLLNKQFTLYRVSLKYLFTGKGAIMEPTPNEPTPEQKTETEKELAVERARNAVLEKLVEAKEAEIRYLREILRLKVGNLEEPDSSNG